MSATVITMNDAFEAVAQTLEGTIKAFAEIKQALEELDARLTALEARKLPDDAA